MVVFVAVFNDHSDKSGFNMAMCTDLPGYPHETRVYMGMDPSQRKYIRYHDSDLLS